MEEYGLPEQFIQEENYQNNKESAAKYLIDPFVVSVYTRNIVTPAFCRWPEDMLNRIFNEDCLIGMKRIPDDSIDAIITDPPYGISKKKPLKGSSKGKIQTISSDWDLFGFIDEFQNFTYDYKFQLSNL